MFSLSGYPWFEAWGERKAMGLQIDGDINESGKAVTSAETGKLLRAALGLEDEKPNRIRSHVTALGWAAKGGIDLPSRHILGHHLDPGAKAAEIYGRDSISSAIRKLCGLLALIKQGRFPLTARGLGDSPTLMIKKRNPRRTHLMTAPRWQLLTFPKHPRSWT